MSKGAKKKAGGGRKAPAGGPAKKSGPLVAPVAVSLPIKRPARMKAGKSGKGGSAGSISVSGQEPIGALVGNTGDVQGTYAFSFSLNPMQFSSRLQLMAQLYERFEFEICSVEYRPAVPTSQAGSWVGFFETDPATAGSNSGTATGYYVASSHETSQTFNAWAPSRITYKRPSQIASFYCYNPDSTAGRLTDQAIFNAVVETPANASGVTMGQFHCHYRVRFYVPQFEPIAAAASGLAQCRMLAAAATTAQSFNQGDWNLGAFNGGSASNFNGSAGIALTFPAGNTKYWIVFSGMYPGTNAAARNTFALASPVNCTVTTLTSGQAGYTTNASWIAVCGRAQVSTNALGNASVAIVFPTQMAMSGSTVGDVLFTITAFPLGLVPNALPPDLVGFRYRPIKNTIEAEQGFISRALLLEARLARALDLLETRSRGPETRERSRSPGRELQDFPPAVSTKALTSSTLERIANAATAEVTREMYRTQASRQ